MQKARRKLILSLFLAVCFLVMFSPQVQAFHFDEVVRATYLVNLEARPKWFEAGQPIDFLVTLRFDLRSLDGFDIGVFHEGRLVGWERNRRLKEGMNTFKIHDRHFQGEPGAYIVRVKFHGRIIKEKRFVTRSQQLFTIDPRARFR